MYFSYPTKCIVRSCYLKIMRFGHNEVIQSVTTIQPHNSKEQLNSSLMMNRVLTEAAFEI